MDETLTKPWHGMKQSKDVMADNRDKYALRGSEKP
jgi:hypothetical protein